MSTAMSNNPMGIKPGYLNWWQSLLLAFSCTMAGVLAVVMSMSGATDAAGQSVPGWIGDMMKLIPHALILYGILADAITYDGVYWTTSIVGLSAIPIHGLMETLLKAAADKWNEMAEAKKGTSGTPSNTSAVQGVLEAARNIDAKPGGGLRRGGGGFSGCTMTGAPSPTAATDKTVETLVVTASVMMYYFFDIWLNRGMTNALGVVVFTTILLGGQTFTLSECPPVKSSTTGSALYALLFGTMIGGAFYMFFQSFYPIYLPSTVIPIQTWASAGSATDSAFVYVPGVGLVSKDSPQGKKAIADGTAMTPDEMSSALNATGTLGTGLPGQASSCPG